MFRAQHIGNVSKAVRMGYLIQLHGLFMTIRTPRKTGKKDRQKERKKNDRRRQKRMHDTLLLTHPSAVTFTRDNKLIIYKKKLLLLLCSAQYLA
jgi:hypothetical protein